eukprot:2112463-Pyramimonas_sp.AAC.1
MRPAQRIPSTRPPLGAAARCASSAISPGRRTAQWPLGSSPERERVGTSTQCTASRSSATRTNAMIGCGPYPRTRDGL